MTVPAMNPLEILLGPEAEQDLRDIYFYISGHSGQEQADAILDSLQEAIFSLALLPLRGSIPWELEAVGISRYRELHVRPWRIIYEPLETVVYIHWIFDSRRDVAGQLAQKMLRG